MRPPAPFGPYLLLDRLGCGGMAEVFLAAARGIGGFEKLLCIKLIRREYADSQAFISMLVEEAKMVSQVVHPNVAQVFDLGQFEGQHYIAMEYVDGVDAFKVLRTAAERGVHLPVPAAALVVRDVTAGLGATHGRSAVTGHFLGIIHRDVSPHNLLLSFEGQVKIIDFGVAKASLGAQNTEAGIIKGKYNYMSPEQASGQRLDHRTDVFSAGIVLWELLAGEHLYPGDNVPKVLELARRARVPPIRTIRSDVPPSLACILERALHKKRERRYQDIAEFSADLDAFLVREAPDYGRRDLAELLGWLFPDGQPRAVTDVPSAASGDLESVPTRVAPRKEILARREARARGLEVQPVPIGDPANRGAGSAESASRCSSWLPC